MKMMAISMNNSPGCQKKFSVSVTQQATPSGLKTRSKALLSLHHEFKSFDSEPIY
jgi:hypothetical protein